MGRRNHSLVWLLAAGMFSVGCGGGPDPVTGPAPSGSASTPAGRVGEASPEFHTLPDGSRVPSDKLIDRRSRTALAPDTLDQRRSKSRPPKTSKEVYKSVAPATVIVRSAGGLGSGIIIDKAGWVLTNHHVIDGGKMKDFEVEVSILLGKISKKSGAMQREQKALVGHVYKVDKLRDLALIKLENPPKNLPVVPISKKKPVPGDRVVSIGHAGAGMLWAIKAGEVSALGKLSEQLASLARFKSDEAGKKASEAFRKRLDKQNLGLVIQSTCNILPGDSGGPLVDRTGALVGVNAFSHKDPRTGGLLSFHIHLAELTSFISKFPKKPALMLPDPWKDGGGDADIDDTDLDGLADTLVLRGRRACRFCPRQSEAIMVDLDQDSFAGKKSLPSLVDIYEKRQFNPEFVYLRVKKDSYVWYDTDNDGSFDVLVHDRRTTGMVDAVYRIKSGGALERASDLKVGRTVRMSLFKDKRLRERMTRVAQTVFPARYRESSAPFAATLPKPVGGAGIAIRGDLNRDGKPDSMKANSSFSSRLLIDADQNFAPLMPPKVQAAKLEGSELLDAEVSLVSQGPNLWAWYDTDDDGRFDLALHSPTQRLYVATQAWTVAADGKKTEAPEHVGRKLVRPGILLKKALADGLQSMVGRGLLGIMSAKDDGLGSFPDPIKDHRGAGFSLLDLKGARRHVIGVNGRGSDGYLLDLDGNSLRGKDRKKLDLKKLVRDGKIDAEVVYFHRNGLTWVFYDTRNKGRFDLVVFTAKPRNGQIDQAFRIAKDGATTLDTSLIGTRLIQRALLRSTRSRNKLKKLAPELFSAAMIEP